MPVADIEALRREIAQLERGSSPVAAERFSTGSDTMDAALGGGIARGGLHEVFAASVLDEPAAAGFTIALALRASGKRPIVWVRQDFVGLELGEIYAPGLAELGLSPERLILVRARDGPSVLRAGEEAARCPPLGAVIIEPWGDPKALDLAASRRLSLAAARSGVSTFMLRAGGSPMPSAAATRWSIRASPSRALEADAPGHPCFSVNLLRDRAGASGRNWTVEWNRDRLAFNDLSRNGAALPGDLVPAPVGGPDHPDDGRRRTG